MSVLQTILESMQSLTTNKMRSGLTVLGIVIGVAAVIAMLAVGRGAQSSITSSINNIGTNLIFVSSGSSNKDVRNSKPLTYQDALAMADPQAAPSVAAVAPVISGREDVTAEGESVNVSISGVTPEYASVTNETLTEGVFVDATQISTRATVAIIGPDTAKNLFGYTDGLVGKQIRIAGTPFTIVGVLKSKGGSGFGSQDDRILVPLTTSQVRFSHGDRNNVSTINVQAVDADSVTQAVEQISQVLRIRHRTAVGLDDFTTFTQQQILSTASTITGVLTIFLGGVAAISLLVGGIGIMNIMLVSVTERTREIGLRKALGARRRDILIQFLTESILLSFGGGVVGVFLAWILTLIVQTVAKASNVDIVPLIGMDSIMLATLFSMGVGLIFGIYPANRAAGLQPVEALRYE